MGVMVPNARVIVRVVTPFPSFPLKGGRRTESVDETKENQLYCQE
jgi:hypothetical protein